MGWRSNDFVIQTNVLPTLREVRFYAETERHIRENHPDVPIASASHLK
jgi:hypothetical protein